MNDVIYPRSRTTRFLRKQVSVPLACGIGFSFKMVPDGEEEIYFSTEIDLKMLDVLARKAAKNSSQTAQHGALKVRIIVRRRLPGLGGGQ
jgi:hypothetical protein